jgi:hypothetical protein
MTAVGIMHDNSHLQVCNSDIGKAKDKEKGNDAHLYLLFYSYLLGAKVKNRCGRSNNRKEKKISLIDEYSKKKKTLRNTTSIERKRKGSKKKKNWRAYFLSSKKKKKKSGVTREKFK